MHMFFGKDRGVRLLEHVRLLERIRCDYLSLIILLHAISVFSHHKYVIICSFFLFAAYEWPEILHLTVMFCSFLFCNFQIKHSDQLSSNTHGHQSSSFKAKCNDNKFICGTSHYAAARFKTCKLFYYQSVLF